MGPAGPPGPPGPPYRGGVGFVSSVFESLGCSLLLSSVGFLVWVVQILDVLNLSAPLRHIRTASQAKNFPCSLRKTKNWREPPVYLDSQAHLDHRYSVNPAILFWVSDPGPRVRSWLWGQILAQVQLLCLHSSWLMLSCFLTHRGLLGLKVSLYVWPRWCFSFELFIFSIISILMNHHLFAGETRFPWFQWRERIRGPSRTSGDTGYRWISRAAGRLALYKKQTIVNIFLCKKCLYSLIGWKGRQGRERGEGKLSEISSEEMICLLNDLGDIFRIPPSVILQQFVHELDMGHYEKIFLLYFSFLVST